MRFDIVPTWLVCLVVASPCACLEPNPNAMDAGDTGTTGADAGTTTGTMTSGTETTGTDTGQAICDPCGLAFESVEFEANADGFSGLVPKPALAHSAPIALVTDYAPGSSESLGYTITWADAGDAWEFDVAVTGAANNSHVGGIAAVIATSEELGPPEVQEVSLTAADMCGSALIEGLGGRAVADAVERYEPGTDLELSFVREASPGSDSFGLDYCITASDTPEAALSFKVIAFATPEGVSVIEIPEVVMNSAAPQSVDYDQFDPGAQVLHLVGAQAFDEAAAPNLGYTISCSATAPWGCGYDLSGFKAGAAVVAGGVIIGIQ
jgi:hypothetical protein